MGEAHPQGELVHLPLDRQGFEEPGGYLQGQALRAQRGCQARWQAPRQVRWCQHLGLAPSGICTSTLRLGSTQPAWSGLR